MEWGEWKNEVRLGLEVYLWEDNYYQALFSDILLGRARFFGFCESGPQEMRSSFLAGVAPVSRRAVPLPPLHPQDMERPPFTAAGACETLRLRKCCSPLLNAGPTQMMAAQVY